MVTVSPHHYSQIADTKKKKWFYRLLTYNLDGKTAKFLPHVGKKILVGTSNGWCISVWNASEMRRIHFSSLLLKVCNADLEILCDGSFSHHVKSYSFMFLQKISTRVRGLCKWWAPLQHWEWQKFAEERGGRWDDGPSPQPPMPNDTEERKERVRSLTTSTTERIEVI